MGETIAFVSYSFHEFVRMLVRWFVARHAKMTLRARTPLKWRPFSDDLKKPGFVLVVSVLGPRWNCHALLANLSPIAVRKTLSIDLAGLRGGCHSWSLVLYDEDFATREWIGSTTTNQSRVTWTLPPGIYSLSLRYYTDMDDLKVPAVTVDGQLSVSGGLIVGEASRYRSHLESIRNRSGFYYRLLHYHTFFYLKHGSKNPEWLRSRFLPVGNPDTEWDYGHLDAGEQLVVRVDSVHERTYNTYVAFYNWASFPVAWHKIQAVEWRSVPFTGHVLYAIRRIRKVTKQARQGSQGVFEIHIDASRRTEAVRVSRSSLH